MLYLPRSNSMFLHCPKTGGTWVCHAIYAAGIPYKRLGSDERGQDALQHAGLEELEEHNPDHVFTFVRHPVAWYRSYWADRQLEGWGGDLIIAHTCKIDEFPEFVNEVIRRHPGFLSSLYERYTGPEGFSSVLVGKTESLAEDLVRILRECGEEFDEQMILDHPSVNLASSFHCFREKTVCESDQVQAICESERVACERHGYATELPPYNERPMWACAS